MKDTTRWLLPAMLVLVLVMLAALTTPMGSRGLSYDADLETLAKAGTYEVGADPFIVVAEDLDGDSAPDVIVTNHAAGSVSVLINKGDGQFQDPVQYPTGTGTAGSDRPLPASSARCMPWDRPTRRYTRPSSV